MKVAKRLGFGLKAAAALVIALGVVLPVVTQVSAQEETVSIDRITVALEAQASVELEALDIGPPGLGAWEIDIFYNSAVVTPVDCSPGDGSICNLGAGPGRIRVTGATASGLVGDTTLASITFFCGEDQGASALTIAAPVFADATVGDPQEIDATIQHGSVTCAEAPGPQPTPREERPTATPREAEEEPTPTATAGPAGIKLPPTGTGGSGGGSTLGWVIAALAGAGLAGTAGLGALRLRARRS
ncbi:MAG: hypothetical protein A2148_01200 [Chloroflexi bacterium RBG_16_68_14]|nr:MAG: hypothetical protein A2148_01200 [Chloroflexi bacterium RBG_16_68_14]